MITKLLLDTKYAKAGTPIAFLDFLPGDMAEVKMPSGEIVQVPAATVEAGHEPEESLPALSEATGIPYDTLSRYAREGRIMARKSAGVWLSTRTAIEYADIKIRHPASPQA